MVLSTATTTVTVVMAGVEMVGEVMVGMETTITTITTTRITTTQEIVEAIGVTTLMHLTTILTTAQDMAALQLLLQEDRLESQTEESQLEMEVP